MSKQFHFRCTSNPNGPILTLDNASEAKEMQGHPDYEQIDEMGEVIIVDDPIEGTIPFQGSKGRK